MRSLINTRHWHAAVYRWSIQKPEPWFFIAPTGGTPGITIGVLGRCLVVAYITTASYLPEAVEANR